MKKIFVCLLSLIGFACVSSEKAKNSAKCFPVDTIKIWEENYCFTNSMAADVEAEVFKECLKKMVDDKSIPKDKCNRIKWLKNKACKDDKMNGHTRDECLSDKNYLENAKDDYRP